MFPSHNLALHSNLLFNKPNYLHLLLFNDSSKSLSTIITNALSDFNRHFLTQKILQMNQKYLKQFFYVLKNISKVKFPRYQELSKTEDFFKLD